MVCWVRNGIEWLETVEDGIEWLETVEDGIEWLETVEDDDVMKFHREEIIYDINKEEY
jgi:hypothetical protein